ncbi:MAG: HAMP domain-containing histidine kinase [Bacteroidales bacterium]|nr:HAMP domain-containing histidine kinase [Bacteroidales bacterium]
MGRNRFNKKTLTQPKSNMEIQHNKLRWNLIIILIAGLIFSSLIFTNSLVKELSVEERKKIELWAEGMKQLSNIDNSNKDITFIFEVIQNNTTVPVILTDEKDSILSYRNFSFPKNDSHKNVETILNKMRNSHEPILVTLLDGKKNYIYYKDSTTLVRLTYYPYILISIIIVFLIITYFAFSQARKAEQNRIWIGLAKETAHQLGTPTSSLLACLDILKEGTHNQAIAIELEKDIFRLEKIADRFSKIGSIPSLEQKNIIEIINVSTDYLKSRVSNRIKFTRLYDEKDSLFIPINAILIEWVIENIVRNAVDAIHGDGEIIFSIHDHIQVVYVDISDNGKGIPKSKYKKIFEPGYTTKSRGWGLGLTLSKRIIEEYHNGKIFINYSEINKGTSFRIVLPKNN